MHDTESEGISKLQSIISNFEIVDDIKNKQPGVSTSSDWEMDEEHPEQWSEADSMDKESMYLMLKTFSPPKPSHSLLTDDPGVTSASAPSNTGGELSSKPRVTSAIQKGLTKGLRSGLFQFFGQGTMEQNWKYHIQETE